MGVDGFRFDLASVLGNTCTVGCFNFSSTDNNTAINRILRDLPPRPATGGSIPPATRALPHYTQWRWTTKNGYKVVENILKKGSLRRGSQLKCEYRSQA
ncbi:MAG: hypothetical protein WB992_07345 [Bryobacteraceae bacterium]